MKTKRRGIIFVIFVAVLAVATAAVMLIWNAVVPAVFGWGVLTYWQALGLLVLARVLFGGLGRLMPHRKMHSMKRALYEDECHPHGRHSGMEGVGHMGGGRRAHFRRMHDSMEGMSWEERREMIREHMAGLDHHEFMHRHHRHHGGRGGHGEHGHHGRHHRGRRGGDSGGFDPHEGQGDGREGYRQHGGQRRRGGRDGDEGDFHGESRGGRGGRGSRHGGGKGNRGGGRGEGRMGGKGGKGVRATATKAQTAEESKRSGEATNKAKNGKDGGREVDVKTAADVNKDKKSQNKSAESKNIDASKVKSTKVETTKTKDKNSGEGIRNKDE